MPRKKASQDHKDEFGYGEQGLTTHGQHHENGLNIVAAMNGNVDAIIKMSKWATEGTRWKVKFLLIKAGISPVKNTTTGKYEFDPKLNIEIPIEEYEDEYADIETDWI